MKTPERVELESHLRELRLPSILREYERTAQDAAKGNTSHEAYLLRLCALEVSDRETRGFAKRVREAKFPSRKTLADFDFPAMPSIDPLAVHRLASCEFLVKAQNILLVGSSGTGKTHLATAVAIEACKRKHSVRFFTVSQLVEALIEARSERMLGRLRAKLKKVSLLVLDELGFVPLPANGAELLFDVVSDRYERGSIILTTNLPFEEWTSVLASEALTHAMLDRLTHHVHILEMNGRSYRLAQSLADRMEESGPKREVALPESSPAPSLCESNAEGACD
jgi:DNA replication protein DnaC